MDEEGRWMPFRVEQYSTLGSSYTRLFFIKARMYGLIPVVGRNGKDVIRPLDLFTASQVTGPEMERAALVTLLNDLFHGTGSDDRRADHVGDGER